MSQRHRILVTGATGFVGQYACAQLRDVLSADIFAAYVGNSAPAGELGEPVAFALEDRGSIEAAIRTVRPTGVLHLAAIALPSAAQADADLAWKINVDGTRHLASALMAHAPKARLVFASSSEVYGRSFNTQTRPIVESAPLRPMTTYAATKAAAEAALVAATRDGLDLVCFRPFNHSGPGQTEAYVISAFARQVAAIEHGLQPAELVTGNLDAYRDFLDVRDVVKAYTAAFATDPIGAADPVFNLSRGVGIQIGDIVSILKSVSSVDIDVRMDAARVRPGEVPRAIGDNSSAMRRFDWTPSISIETTVHDTLAHWQSYFAKQGAAERRN